MAPNTKSVLALLACLAVPRAAHAQTPATWPQFKQLFQQFVSNDSIVGASALVMRDGRVLDRIELGYADRAQNVRIDTALIFHWGSITKGLTAISIMQLRDRGRLKLEDHVVDYIPELRQVHDPFGAIDSITIRMLLSHTAGFMNGTWPYGRGEDWEPFEPTRWEQLVAMMPYQQIHFKPGTRYSYSNPGFIYLARIIEKLTGDPWESYVQKNIFAPLGLTQSYFRNTPYYLAAHRSHNYSVDVDSATHSLRVNDHGADFDPGITVPNGGWNAPLSELARYTAFLLGEVPNDVVLKRSTLLEMWQPVAKMSAGYQSGPDQYMGMSFMINGDVLGHTGHQANFGAFFYFNPKKRTAVIAVYNTSVNTPGAEAKIQQAAVDLLK